MTTQQMEDAIDGLPDPKWRSMKEAFYGVQKDQIAKYRTAPFVKEITEAIEQHYRQLLIEILELSGR